ncbi:hypothetical protein [Hoeflea sp.]|uniref:hypothetical protein n=1 Tax=Hoeflea sp. TaxID=1940281 RepID=UPI003BB15CD0
MTDSDKPSGDRPANEIEVTPEMIEAGALSMSGYDPDFDTLESISLEIFRAMIVASPKGFVVDVHLLD